MNFKHIETGQLNNESLNDDENMLILKSESNKNVLVLRFMGSVDYIYDLSDKRDIGFNVISSGKDVSGSLEESLKHNGDYKVFVCAGSKVETLMCFLLSYAIVALTKGECDEPDENLYEALLPILKQSI